MERKTISVNITQETEDFIRRACTALWGDDAREEDIGELVSNFLPELIADALASDTQIAALCSNLEQPTTSEEDERPPITGAEIAEAVAAAEAEKEAEFERAVMPELDMHELEAEAEEYTDRPPSLDELLASPEGQSISSAAIIWAKGHPGKEAALAETLWQLPTGMWGMNKVRELAERTWNIRGE